MFWIGLILLAILAVLLFGAAAVRGALGAAGANLLLALAFFAGLLVLNWLGLDPVAMIGVVIVVTILVIAFLFVFNAMAAALLNAFGFSLGRFVSRVRKGGVALPPPPPPPTVPLPPSFLHDPERALIHAKRRRDRHSTVVESPTEAPAPPPSFAPQDHQFQPPVHPPWTPDLADDTDEDIDDGGWDDDDDDLDDETTLIDGMAKRVHLHYADAQGEATRRDVELQRVTAFRGAVYLEGYCQLRRGPRNFRLDRCLEIQDLETGEVFTPEELAEELGVTLHFSTDAA